LYFEDKDIADKPIKDVMSNPYPIVKKSVTLEKISALINKDNQAVIVDLGAGKFQMITKHDIIRVIH